MKAKRSIWTTITGGLTSATPILLSCCKSGACVGVCASPIASLFGISSATIASSPLVNAIEPLLIAVSAVSFTVSYYSLYVLPKSSCNTSGGCDCGPTDKEIRRNKLNKFVFWFGLILSIGFLSYFEIQKYQSAVAVNTECSGSSCAPGECSEDTSDACCEGGDSTTCEKAGTEIQMQSQITCPNCKFSKSEIMPTDVCLLSYTCQKCQTVMHPINNDCCVFCSYGDHKCPSKQ